MNRMYRKSIIALFLFALATQVLAQSTTTPPPQPYEVEVLVFQNKLSYLEGEELWTSDSVNVKLPDLTTAVEPENIFTPDSPLAKAAVTLEADANFRVLLHARWAQDAGPKSDTKWVYLHDSRVGEAELEGVLRFYRGRFLHVNLEFLFRDKEAGPFTSQSGGEPSPYRISEHRRIRSRDINYFDHPKFGALVRVTPLR
ncbi:MAG: CsiV family protein [Acidiferrobacterales bacterium]